MSRALLIAGCVAWAMAIGFGMSVLWSYENAPGVAGAPPSQWPAATRIPAPHHRATLVMVVHPHCSCSHASVAELARLMAAGHGQVDSYVLVLSPDGMPDEWARTQNKGRG